MRWFYKALSVFAFVSCQQNQERIQPTVEDISESVYASGIVKSRNQYQVFSTVNGIINDILVTEGDLVEAGTPIIKIINKTTVLSAKNAELAAEYARISANTEKLDELKMGIEIAKDKLKNDSLLLHRQQVLWNQSIGTRIELEQRELNYKNSILNFQSAETRYNDFKRQLKLNASQSQNNLRISTTLADDYILRSEIKGKVYDILKEKGELITTQAPVALIGNDSSFLLDLQVDEYDIARIREKQEVLITMDSYKDRVFKGILVKINPVMNERTKSFTVEAEFITRPPVLYPFLTVEANIIIQKKSKALTIPRAYLIDNAYVITHNGKRKRVETGLKDYEKVEILEGLTSDEFILRPKE